MAGEAMKLAANAPCIAAARKCGHHAKHDRVLRIGLSIAKVLSSSTSICGTMIRKPILTAWVNGKPEEKYAQEHIGLCSRTFSDVIGWEYDDGRAK
jgi:hypothetical protein